MCLCDLLQGLQGLHAPLVLRSGYNSFFVVKNGIYPHDIGLNDHVAFRCTILQHFLCRLHCALTTPSQVSLDTVLF